MPINDLNRQCRHCGKPFVLPHRNAQRMAYCSPYCRVWARVDDSGGDESCWNWRGARTQAGKGYGVLNVGGKLVGAHRIAFEARHGIEPGNLFVCHHCDNVLCCNPSHLFLGTAADNNDDKNRKGRNIKTPEGRERIGASKIGRPRSAECIAKMSAALKGRAGINKGVPRSEAHREKLRAAWVVRRARDFPHLA